MFELQPTQLLILGGAGVVAVAIILFGVITSRREDAIAVRLEQVERDMQEIEFIPVPEEDAEDSGVLDEGRRLLAPLERFVSERKFGQSMRRNLARADIKLKVSEYIILHFVSAAGFFTFGWLILFRGDIVMSTVAGLVGFLVPRIYVSREISKRLIAFETQLPDTLGLWVNALRSGYSVLQAMEAIAQDAPEPTKSEFRRVVQEVQIGIDMPDALEHLLERIDSPDLDLVVTAVNIQREVGGNLAEILGVIAETIRERIKLKGEIRVLTSQGRITGYIISALPILVALFLYVINPAYMGQLFTNQSCGWPMLGLGLALIGIGAAIIQKIVDIEI